MRKDKGLGLLDAALDGLREDGYVLSERHCDAIQTAVAAIGEEMESSFTEGFKRGLGLKIEGKCPYHDGTEPIFSDGDALDLTLEGNKLRMLMRTGDYAYGYEGYVHYCPICGEAVD